MFGPFTSAMLADMTGFRWRGDCGCRGSDRPVHGWPGRGNPSVRGSVMTPVEGRCGGGFRAAQETLSSLVPERPGKLRGTVRRLIACRGRGLAHADAAVAAGLMKPCTGLDQGHRWPSRIRFSRIAREVGLTSKETRRWTGRPSTHHRRQ